jgi:hypothetical protein
MCDPTLWALMQRVERLRFRAELLERASIDQPRPVRRMLLQLAAHSRDMADRAYADGLPSAAPAEVVLEPAPDAPSQVANAPV